MALKGAIMDADIYGHRQEIRLDERQLNLAVGVSRTPIREAMTLLEQEGFLRTAPRPGIFIVWKTKKEIIEVCAAVAAARPVCRSFVTRPQNNSDATPTKSWLASFASSCRRRGEHRCPPKFEL